MNEHDEKTKGEICLVRVSNTANEHAVESRFFEPPMETKIVRKIGELEK